MRCALAGRGMWIWYVSRSSGGTLSSIIATARQYGVSTLIIKSGDGPTMWSQFNPTVVASSTPTVCTCARGNTFMEITRSPEAEVGAQAVQRRRRLPGDRRRE